MCCYYYYEYSCELARLIPHGVRVMNLQPPTPFSFVNSEEWPKWKLRFEQYRHASGLVEKDEQRQVSTLLYCLGEEAEEVLNTTRISDDNRKKYQKIIREFDKYFRVKKNMIYEHARFNIQMKQRIVSSQKYMRWQTIVSLE